MTRKKKEPFDVEISIDHLAKDGSGVGQVMLPNSSQVYTATVPFTAPQDVVLATIGKKKRGNCQAALKEILKAAPSRQKARCPHFGLCGGCSWQHIPYSEQLKIKEKAVSEYFTELLHQDVEFFPIIASEPSWYYRNKMEYSFSSDKSDNHFLGLCIKNGRGKVFNLKECYLTSGWMVEAVQNVRQWWSESNLKAYHHSKDIGSLRTLTLREGLRSGDRMAILTVSGNPNFALNSEQLKSFVAFLRAAMEWEKPDSKISIFLNIQQIAKGQRTNFFEMLLHGEDHIRETLFISAEENKPSIPYSFTISPSAFFQPNTLQAEKLYSRALQLACLQPEDILYDLYCGTGTLGICAAKKVQKVIGIELSPESSLDAKNNAKKNNLNNIEIICGDAAEVIKLHLEESSHNTLQSKIALVDPPRAGLTDKALTNLLSLAPKKIVYISCNPASQAQNIGVLTSHGYSLTALQPVDQFPYTPHIENIALLCRD